MAQYEKVFTKPYEDGYVDLPNQTTPITAETLNDKDTAIEHIEDYLHDNDANGNLADDYDSTATYSIGDYAVYEGVLYRCITAVSTAEDFDDDKWTAVSVGAELELKANATDIPTALSELTDDSTHRLVTDTEKASWDNKSDISSIGTDESGRTTASKAYAIGEHFYKDGKFCTAKTAIASGETFTLNTNYVEGTIADAVRYEESVVTPLSGVTFATNQLKRFGKVVDLFLQYTTPSDTSINKTLATTPFKPSNNYTFFAIVTNGSPYSVLGYCFVRGSTGEIVLPSGIQTNTGVNITGTYICQ